MYGVGQSPHRAQRAVRRATKGGATAGTDVAGGPVACHGGAAARERRADCHNPFAERAIQTGGPLCEPRNEDAACTNRTTMVAADRSRSAPMSSK
jgi:hypothetical protein